MIQKNIIFLLVISFFYFFCVFSVCAKTSGENLDADGILWGTEIYPDQLAATASLPQEILKTKMFKVRIQGDFLKREGNAFSSVICMPSHDNCRKQYDMDEVAQFFKAHNYSMMPMFTFLESNSQLEGGNIDKFVETIVWFVNRYKKDANIQYIELQNCPVLTWKGTSAQLVELTNKVYDCIKASYPDILVGTPGFEYWMDRFPKDRSVQQIEYFLDKANGAKFDFWAFHGYPLIANKMSGLHAPTAVAVTNQYAGINGIKIIRQKLDANGWQDRLMMDTEHIGIIAPGLLISEKGDVLDSAYMVQELVLKRTMKVNDKFVLDGIFPLKMIHRGPMGEFAWGSLNSDGSMTKTLKAVSILRDFFSNYQHDSHVSGQLGDLSQPWIERFKAKGKELYIFFKPFEIFSKNNQPGNNSPLFDFDNTLFHYTLSFNQLPQALAITDIAGNKIELVPTQSVTLDIGNAPKFLEVSYAISDGLAQNIDN